MPKTDSDQIATPPLTVKNGFNIYDYDTYSWNEKPGKNIHSYHIVFDEALPFEATPSIFDSIADSVWFSDISKFWDYHVKGPKKSLLSSKIFFAPPPPKIQEKKTISANGN